MEFQICTGSKENIGVTRQNGTISFSLLGKIFFLQNTENSPRRVGKKKI